MPRKIALGMFLITVGLVGMALVAVGLVHTIPTTNDVSERHTIVTDATEGGWNIVQMQNISLGLGMNHDVGVLRTRIAEESGRFYLHVEQCMYSPATLQRKAPCRKLVVVETVPSQ